MKGTLFYARPAYRTTNPKSKIQNPHYDRAIIALLTQPSIAEAARSCGLGESTLRRWLHQPDFAHAYSQARQQAFSVALGYLQNLSEQAVTTLQVLMQDSQVAPSVRLAAARTVMQMSFKGAERFILQPRLDQLETGLAALEEEPPTHTPSAEPPEPATDPKATIDNRQSSIDNRKRRWWWKRGIASRSTVEEDAGLNRSNPLYSSHPPKTLPLPEEGSLRGRDSNELGGAEPGAEQEGSPLRARNERAGEGTGEGLSCSNPLYSAQSDRTLPLPSEERAI